MDNDASVTAPLSINELAAQALNEAQAGRRWIDADARADLGRLTVPQAESWIKNGYFILPKLVSEAVCAEMSRVIVDMFSNTETAGHSIAGHHVGRDGMVAVEEAARIDSGKDAGSRMSKLFNIHRKSPFLEFAKHPELLNVMQAILGRHVSCFNSQYIFKNPGVWGQPWHQDSLYYKFDRMPQVGAWLATTKATIENGCLFVAPGSHREPIHTVIPDRRPGSNYGYLEITDYDFSNSTPVLMEPGDVLIFHSFLMHMSNDNTSSERRSALVYHYANAATQVLGEKSMTLDFMQVS